MVPKFLRINGITRTDRHEMISRVKAAITERGGWILDFKLFSNVSVCINFELLIKNIEKLYSSLAETNLTLSAHSS